MDGKTADEIIETLFRDMGLRRGFRQLIDEIDEETIEEIKSSWRARILEVVNGG